MSRYLPLIPLAFIVALVLPSLVTRAEPSGSQWLSPQDVRVRQEAGEVLVVDVRTPGEFARGHVEGALNLPLSDVEGRLGQLRSEARGRPVVLYCRSGRRARIAEEILRRGGVEPVWHLQGQLAGWSAAGLPVGQ